MKKLIYMMLFIPLVMTSQETIKGMVMEANDNKEHWPLPGANVYWLDTSVGTVTDSNGNFEIAYQPSYKKLIISFVGYKTDTLTIDTPRMVHHWLQPTSDLDEVTIKARKQATAKSYLKAENVLMVSSDELLKAACCNLSESFETNPSIDVNFSDAVTGTRQIKMLGLTSPYILIATENVPTIRGASQAYGLSFIPGTWVESIQITKGAGSVVNGFESISGQINAELQKPISDDRLFVNAYGALNGRLELNTHLNTKVSERWSTGVYLHGNLRDQKNDMNDDGFLDMPLAKQLNVMNRWQYTNPQKGLVSFLNVRVLMDDKQAGEVDFNPDTDKLTTNAWGSEIDTRRLDASGKLGYVNPELTWQSLGLQVAFSSHYQDSYFGLNQYAIQHNSLYTNLVYNSIISDSRHNIKTGVTYMHDYYRENLDVTNLDTDFKRVENNIGGFFEYSFDNIDDFSLTAGLRLDNHNLLGVFLTPRLHVRYTPWEKSALRFSVGRGKRSANIFTENQNLFASSRQFNVVNMGGTIYGLDPEIAWNYGVSFLQGFNVFGRKADVTVDFYRTDFKNQIVVDMESQPSGIPQVGFYNLRGDSYANSLQVEFNINPFDNVDIRTAYKFYDVKTQYSTGKLERPLTPRHRLFANISYETMEQANGSQWKWDATYNVVGKQRLASTANYPAAVQLADYTPTVQTLNMQITRVFSPKFEVYLGGENITNYRQSNPIISTDNPFGTYFDSTFVYGPIFGANYYIGLRFNIP